MPSEKRKKTERLLESKDSFLLPDDAGTVNQLADSKKEKVKTSGRNIDLKQARELILKEMENIKKDSRAGSRFRRFISKIETAPKQAVSQPEVPKPKPKIVEPAKPVPPTNKSNLPRVNRFYLSRVLIFLLVLFFVSCLALLYGIYYGKMQGPMVDKISKLISLPAAYVNGQPINLSLFNNDVDVMRRYFDRSAQPTSEKDLRKKTMETLIQLKVMEQIAKEKNILVTDTEVNYRLKDVLKSQNDRLQAEAMTYDLYGWDFNTFAEKVLRPLILAQKVEKQFYEEYGEKRIIQQLNEVRDLLLDDPNRFDKLAAELNEDTTKDSNGDLGWLKLGETAPEFEIQLLNLKTREISNVILTRFGYHLIYLVERMVNSEGQTVFQVKHIFKKKPSFEDYLQEQIKKSKVLTLIRI